MSAGLDHGILNLPLAKRGGGSLDAQIDRWKADTKRAAKAEAKRIAAENKAATAEAKALIAALPDDLVARVAARAGKTPKQMRKRLMADAYWQPQRTLALLKRLTAAPAPPSQETPS